MPAGTRARADRNERLLMLASLTVVCGLSWLYLWIDAGHMEEMTGGMGMAAMKTSSWEAGPLLLTFVMWSVMMVGMMLPSASPAILLYGAMVRKNREAGTGLPSAWIFTAGYLAVWTAFSSGATVLQAGLEEARLLTPMMDSASAWLSGILLIAAGIYQWLPIKAACLEKCRAPLQFFLFRWRAGPWGAFLMGAEHGLFCVGCCWALMLLLFTAGVMNLLWVALIAAFVLVEKMLPAGGIVGRVAGVALAVVGTWMITTAI